MSLWVFSIFLLYLTLTRVNYCILNIIESKFSEQLIHYRPTWRVKESQSLPKCMIINYAAIFVNRRLFYSGKAYRGMNIYFIWPFHLKAGSKQASLRAKEVDKFNEVQLYISANFSDSLGKCKACVNIEPMLWFHETFLRFRILGLLQCPYCQQ